MPTSESTKVNEAAIEAGTSVWMPNIKMSSATVSPPIAAWASRRRGTPRANAPRLHLARTSHQA